MKLYLLLLLVLFVCTSSCSLLEEVDSEDFNSELISSDFYLPGIAIDVGVSGSCATKFDKTIKCWGLNDKGQLGDGTTDDRTTPVTVSGISTATRELSVGSSHTCAVLSGGTVKCWGLNDKGQLGDGTTTDRSIPVTVSGISTVTAVSAGRKHACAVLSGGTVQCWGLNG
ncbi:MAG: hypothetical protein P8O70_22055, partial [SAR324 cluster bacterium]|nr:hypothetical protein [SAR324 cluster bacterium]